MTAITNPEPSGSRMSCEDDIEGQYKEDRALLNDSDPFTSEHEQFEIEEPEIDYGRQRSQWSRNRSSLGGLGHAFRWIHGPATPRPFRITPILPGIQTAPIDFLDRILPTSRCKLCLIAVLFAIWALHFSIVLYGSLSPELEGYGNPVRLSCTSRLWSNSTRCGMDGEECRPFEDHFFAFQCPASCKEVKVLEPHFIGPAEVNYRSLVIGGGQSASENGSESQIYRADSFICAAALHADIFSDTTGGCGVVKRVGKQYDFPGTEANGISSISFPSYFPSSFTFEQPEESNSRCQDKRWSLLALSVVYSSLISIFSTTPAPFFTTTFTGLFFHVALVSDPPNYTDYSETFSTATGRFLPTAFIGAIIYHFCARPALKNLTAPLEKTLLWLGGAWVGALHNYTFDNIPISRLTPHDIKQQPGAIPALIILVLILLAIAIRQAYAFWREGRLATYLRLYALMAVGILIILAVPNMNLRIHHYILALLLLPGTALQTRPSLLYQGILLGLFINGIARWGFDSVLQTAAQLQGDAQVGSLMPDVRVVEASVDSISFALSEWAEEAVGFSVLVNDVESFRRWKADGHNNTVFSWRRHVYDFPEYFRFGYIFRETMGHAWYGDFTKAGTWETNGAWTSG